jgi:ArsR family transcriptional regulator
MKPKKDIVMEMSEVFKALGDPTRLRIIRMLASKMESNLSVSDLAKKLGITQPSASQHIKVLKNVGILESSRDGYYIYYNVNVDVLKEYKKNIDPLFEMAFTKCENYGKCKGHGGE